MVPGVRVPSFLETATLDIHVQLEEKLAKFMKEGCGPYILYRLSGKSRSNLGNCGQGMNVVIIDKMDHASIVDGCKLSLWRGKEIQA